MPGSRKFCPLTTDYRARRNLQVLCEFATAAASVLCRRFAFLKRGRPANGGCTSPPVPPQASPPRAYVTFCNRFRVFYATFFTGRHNVTANLRRGSRAGLICCSLAKEHPTLCSIDPAPEPPSACFKAPRAEVGLLIALDPNILLTQSPGRKIIF